MAYPSRSNVSPPQSSSDQSEIERGDGFDLVRMNLKVEQISTMDEEDDSEYADGDIVSR